MKSTLRTKPSYLKLGWARLCRVMITAITLTLAIATLLGPVLAAAQDGRSVVWDEIDVTVELRDDSSLAVTERDTIEFRGGPFRRGFREVPLARVEDFENIRAGELVDGVTRPYEYVTPRRFSADVPNTYTYQTVGSVLRIEWSFPPTTSETRTFELTYDALGALRTYPDNDPPYQQISWIGVGRELTESAPVNEARLTIILPTRRRSRPYVYPGTRR